MELITQEYLFRAEVFLLITTLLYFMMNGAGIFETTVVIPKWSANAPESFQLFKKPYRIDLKTFWIVMHSIHELSFILAIVFCWHLEPVRNCLLILFGIHFAIRVWTLTYFAPDIMSFQKMTDTGEYTLDLKARVKRWKNLNYIRTGLFIAVSIALIPLCLQVFHWSN